MPKEARSIVVLGAFEVDALNAVREAAEAVSSPVLAQTEVGAMLDATDTEPPLVLLTSAQTSEGFETCARIRSDTRFAGTPIIVVGDPKNALSFTELFQSGGDDIVARGDVESLARRLRAVCSRPAPREASLPGVESDAVIAGKNPTWQRITARAFSNAGVPVRFVDTVEAAIAESRDAKVVIASDDLGPHGAHEGLAEARRTGAQTPWVIVAPPKRVAEIAAAVSTLTRFAVIDAFAPPENALFVANDLANPSGADNRSAVRLLYGTTTAFRVAGNETDDVGFTYNVSATGIFLRTLAPLNAGSDVWLELCAPRSSRRVRLVGSVAWRRHFGPNDGATVPAGFGVRITEGLTGDLQRWRDGCELLARDELRARPSRFAPAGRSSYIPSVLAPATV